MKQLIPYLLPIILLLISGPLFAPMKYSWSPNENTTQVGFSLQNRSDSLIQFQIYNESAGIYHRHVLELQPNGEYGIQLNTNIQTKLKIYHCPDASGSCSELNLPKADIIETSFPVGKTMYISWDGRDLVPQNEERTRDVTKAGYFLTNNVQDSDYNLVQSKESNKIYPKEIGRDPWEVFPKAQTYLSSLDQFGNSLRVAEAYTDITLSLWVLGLMGGLPAGGTPTDEQINQAWDRLSRQWNPDDHPDEPNFARAVMQIINRSQGNLVNSVIKTAW